jgi:YbbR domain-containing protein
VSAAGWTKDWALKIAALLLSLLLWLHVQSQESTKKETSFTVPVEVVNVPDSLVVASKPPDLTVTLRGLPEVIDQFNSQNRNRKLRAFADASDAREGPVEFRVSLEPRAELLGLEPEPRPTVTVEFEGKTEKSFIVEVVPGGEPPTGFEFGTAVVDPPEVNLIGPKSKVARVGTVRAVLDLGKIRSGAAVQVPVEVLDIRGAPVPADQVERRPAQVEITPALTPAKPNKSLLVSPRFVGQPAPGFHVSRVEVVPREVMVQGDRDRVAAISLIETEPISLAGLRRTTIRTVEIRVPTGVSVQNRRQVRVTIQIEPDQPVAPPPGP